ncbi:hypothetical protein NUM3379_01660 [Kineococcus sp. NUM-3379]
MKNRTRGGASPALRTLTAFLTAVAVGGAGAPAAFAAGQAGPAAAAAAETVRITDPGATPATRSLFSYLRDVRGEGILFGHQHTTSYGVTTGPGDGTASDVQNGVGDMPAVFGWDTLIIEGNEHPGVRTATREQNVETLAQYMEKAHAQGGINTLTAHMENFVTGGSFYDTKGDTARAVLPGGSKHAELNRYLDHIALLADSTRDANGELIPIIFRPWHENTGSWFWWGASYLSPGEFVELYRYTVEYLRDTKGVRNLLYAYSPNGGFGGDPTVYMRTYPGDDFVDVLGYDAYDSTGGSQGWRDGVVKDLAMVADLAEQRGKIPAFTEFGIAGPMKVSGNPNLTWFTDLLDAIEADPKARQATYMQTWANFGLEQFFVPYPASAAAPEHEMFQNFKAYEEDPYSYFADEVQGAFTRQTSAAPLAPYVHVVTPADGARVKAAPATVRASIRGVEPDRVYFTVGGDTTAHEMTKDQAGFWSAQWAVPAAELDNSTETLEVHVVDDGEEVLADESSFILGERPQLPPGVVDHFEGYGDDAALRAEFSQVGSNTLTLERGTIGQGTRSMRIGYDFTAQSYTGVGKQLTGDWSGTSGLRLWYAPDGSGNKLVLQLSAGGVGYEAYPPLTGTTPGYVTIPWSDWRPAPWDTANEDRRISAADLADLRQFSIYVNHVEGMARTGSVVVDDIAAVEAAPRFGDVPRSDPHFAAVEWVAAEGIDTGYPDGTFRAGKDLRRGDLAAWLFRYSDAQFADPAKPTYKDVKAQDPLYTEIEWATAQGLIGGEKKDKFSPNLLTTRAVLAEALWKLAGSPEPARVLTFRDVAASDPRAKAISWVVEKGLLAPHTAVSFGADRAVQRGPAAAVLQRYSQLPPPPAPVDLVIEDFADGVEGWKAPDGTVTAGAGNLVVTSTGGTWLSTLGSWDLSTATQIRVDVVETAGLTGSKLALQVGPNWTWCETAVTGAVTGPRVDGNAVVYDLSTLSADCKAGLKEVRGLNLFLDAGRHVLDDVERR